MNKLVSNIFLLLSLLFCFSACEEIDDLISKEEQDEKERKEYIAKKKGTERTVLVYIAANGNLAGYARTDLQEMALGMEKEEADDTRYNFLVYSDTGADPALFRFVKDQYGEVMKDTIASYSTQDSLDPEIMQSVFNLAFKTYPADNYGLILWSHAEGWIESATDRTRSIGPSAGKYMNISEFKEVLENVSPYFDYIYFETCFMSSVEVLYELRQYADYVIACPAETPGTGAPYDLVLEAMLTNKPLEIGKIYFEHYNSIYQPKSSPTNSSWTAGVCIAVIKNSALDALAAATNNLFLAYMSDKDLNYLDNIRSQLACYDLFRTKNNYYYDLDGLMKDIVENDEDYQQWKKLYDDVVVYYETTETIYSSSYPYFLPMEGSTGLSIYIPRSSQRDLFDFYKTYEWYVKGGWEATNIFNQED